MTRIAAFIGDDSIVVASDGLAVDQAGRVVDTRARKIFRLSPYCVILASGRAASHLMSFFNTVSAQYNVQVEWQAESIANDVVNIFNESDAAWLDGIHQTFIIAGYNITNNVFKPQLFALLKRPEGWTMHTSMDDQPFMVAGNHANATHKIIAEEFAAVPKDTANLNKYALRVIKQSAALAPQTIGGAPGLWNIFPAFDRDVQRFMPSDMLAL